MNLSPSSSLVALGTVVLALMYEIIKIFKKQKSG
jgi:hypothetical protein